MHMIKRPTLSMINAFARQVPGIAIAVYGLVQGYLLITGRNEMSLNKVGWLLVCMGVSLTLANVIIALSEIMSSHEDGTFIAQQKLLNDYKVSDDSMIHKNN